MKLVVFTFVCLCYSASYAQGVSERINSSNSIMKIYREACQTAFEKSSEVSEIREMFELAASYTIHGEYNNMKEQLLRARSISKNADCQKSIDSFLN